MFILKKVILFLLLAFSFLACTPAETPTPETDPVSAVPILEAFYQRINTAQSVDDLNLAWAMLSNDAQCSPIEKCELTLFQEKWFPLQVSYKLYDCGDGEAIAEEIRFPRGESLNSVSASPRYWKYKITAIDDVYMIDKISLVQELADGCVLKVESQPVP